MTAFSDKFVHQLQENQHFRYNQVMQALNMSAALTARKTKEFRSPPEEQVEKNNNSVFVDFVISLKITGEKIVLLNTGLWSLLCW